MALSTRRGYQDYLAWSAYGTAELWGKCVANPALAGELIAQYLSKGGLKCPKETTSADVTARILAAQWGPSAMFLQDSEIEAAYNTFKARPCKRSTAA